MPRPLHIVQRVNSSEHKLPANAHPGAPAHDEAAELLEYIDATMYRMGRLMSSRQAEFQRESGLPAPQFMVLKTLDCVGPTRISDLAGMLGVKSPAMSMLVQDLEAESLISRAHDTEDNRVVRVSLTEEGSARLERAEGFRRELMRRLTSGLSLEDLRTFARIVDALAEGASDGGRIQE